MSSAFVEAIGLMAGLLTTISFVPQARHAWRTRSTKDISLAMYLAFTSGVLLWLIYGFLIGSLSVVLANAVTLVLALFILALKMRHG
jgi:MtN3 and saliva related transmembrane protein